MQTRIVVSLLVLLLAIAGCSRDEPAAPTPATSDPLAAAADRLYDAAVERAEAWRSLAAAADLGESALKDQRRAVLLPPGADALAAALAEAGPGGAVILAPGLHTESGTILIEHTVRIIGQKGSVLQIPSPPTIDFSVPIAPAIHVRDAADVVIWNVDLRPDTPIGGTGILLDGAPGAVLGHNAISGWQYCVLAGQADDLIVLDNKIATTDAWLDGTVPEALGLTIANAERSVVTGNVVSGGLFGMWPCDKDGVMYGNNVTACLIGIIFCKVPAGGLILPDGTDPGAEFSASGWVARHNTVTDCYDANYLVIDGSNRNHIANNISANPGTYDYDLVGDSYRFGFLTPTSFENVVIIGPNQSQSVVKDCGVDNVVQGGILVDNATDPCY